MEKTSFLDDVIKEVLKKDNKHYIFLGFDGKKDDFNCIFNNIMRDLVDMELLNSDSSTSVFTHINK